ncbi:MAG: hypothetical protein C0524_06665 [Rhodobacter sp.]|nr:hypothetical protein [Rhodobacter sp.]
MAHHAPHAGGADGGSGPDLAALDQPVGQGKPGSLWGDELHSHLSRRGRLAHAPDARALAGSTGAADRTAPEAAAGRQGLRAWGCAGSDRPL